MENDKIYTFPNTEEARETAVKALNSLLNVSAGTLLGDILPLFTISSIFTAPDERAVYERISTIDKIMKEAFRKLKKRAKLPKKRKTTYKTIRRDCAKRNR